MNPSIEELQRRIAELQNPSISSPSTAKVEEPSPNTDLKSIIRDILREELQVLKDSTLVTPEPVIVPKKELNLLDAIGLCLTEEEQLWVSKPEILAKVGEYLTSFIQTESGREFVRQFIKYFKGIYEN